MEHENPEDPESPTKLEAIGSIIGARMFKAARYSGMQEKSVTAKRQNFYDSAVSEGIQKQMPPKFKMLKKAAEYLGLDFDEILGANEVVPFMKSLDKNGLAAMFTQNDGEKW